MTLETVNQLSFYLDGLNHEEEEFQQVLKDIRLDQKYGLGKLDTLAQYIHDDAWSRKQVSSIISAFRKDIMEISPEAHELMDENPTLICAFSYEVLEKERKKLNKSDSIFIRIYDAISKLGDNL